MAPTPFLLLVLIVAWWSTPATALRNFVLLSLLGATAAINVTALGGAPISPAIVMLPVLMWMAWRVDGGRSMLSALGPGRAGIWLGGAVLCGVLSAYFMPRVFLGETTVLSTARTGVVSGVQSVLLRPSSTNITQSAYALAALSAFAAAAALVSREGGARRFVDAMLFLGALNCGFALLDMAEQNLGLPSLLSLLRNANYAIMTGGSVAGLIRISGTFPEASAFAGFSLPLLVFAFVAWRCGYRRRLSGTVALCLAVLLALSTSSTAYVSLVLCFSVFVLAHLRRSLRLGSTPRLGFLSVALWLAAVVVCLLVLFSPEFVSAVTRFFEVTVVRKLESSSGEERGAWNRQAWQVFLDTYGLGAGLGSTRASSYPLVLLSNVGLLGTILYAIFLMHVARAFVRADSPDVDAIGAKAAAAAVLAALVSATVSATVFDLGMLFYVLAAGAVTLGSARGTLSAQTSPLPPNASIAGT